MEVGSNGVVRALVRALPSFEEEMLLLRHFVDDGDVCLDVGASYGLYTVVLARLAGRAGHVHAFEPRPRSRRVLQAVTRNLTPGNVTIHPSAVGAEPGADVIVTPHRRWGLPVPGRSFLRGGLDGQDPERRYYDGWGEEFGRSTEHLVEVRTLDGVVEERGSPRIVLLKIDVEGGELAVMRGAERTIERDRPVILCEIEDRHTQKYGHRADDVLAWLADRGYSAHRLYGQDLRPVRRVEPASINYVFLTDEQENRGLASNS